MPNKKITQFEDNLNPLGSDVFPIVNNGVTKKQSLSGLTFMFSGSTDTYITGGTYSDGTTVFTYNTGGTFSVTGYSTGTTSFDTYVTGGTYLDGTATFTNNSGGTFDVTGFSTGFTIQDVSATGSGIVNNVSLQELGGVDKLINGIRVGQGNSINNKNTVFGTNSQTGSTGNNNTSIGYEALNNLISGNFNSAFGSNALRVLVSSGYNSAFGQGALGNLTGGTGLNTAIGQTSLSNNKNGQRNTAVGTSSGAYTLGSQNTIVGTHAGGGSASANVTANTGSNNISIGYQAARAITSGSNNIQIENITNDSITTGNYNIIIDPRNKTGVQTGNNNVLIGGWDGAFGSSISDTIAFGTGGGTTRFLSDITGTFLPQQTKTLINTDISGKAIVTKEYLIGFSGLTGSSTPVSATGSGIVNNVSLQELGGVDKTINGVRIGRGNSINDNTVFGYNSQSGTTTGFDNHSFGFEALAKVTTGGANDAFGWRALYNNTSGNSNEAFGDEALRDNTTGVFNIGIGSATLLVNQFGSQNIAIGGYALSKNVGVDGSNIQGHRSIAIGTNAMEDNTTGNGIAIGNVALGNQTTGAWNIALGFQAGSGISTGTRNTIIAGTGFITAGGGITTGNDNLIVAQNDGNTTGISTGSRNTILGKVSGLSAGLSDTIIVSTGGGSIRFQSDITGSLLPAQTIALINSEATGKAIVTKEYLNDINTNVVHKTLVESITGQKTFSAQTLYYDTMNLKSGWFVTDAGTKVGIRRLPNNPDSASGLQVEGPILINNGAIEFATGDVTRNVFAQGAFDILRLRNYNIGEPSTILDISARVGDPTSAIREATLSLTRGDDTVNAEFVDVYNNGYFTGTSIEVQYGIRIQKRGTGVYRPFIFDWYDGTTKDAGYIAEQTTGFTFFKPVVVNHLKINSLTGSTSVNNLGIDASGNVVTGLTTHWSAGTGTNAIATRNGNNIASNNYALAEGNNTIASGTSSHAEGNFTIAGGANSHAEGGNTRAIGFNSHAEGAASEAIGNYSHSEGEITIASGQTSHAEGRQTQANGNYSHAEGNQTKTYGQQSHAEGNNTIASGTTSHAEGDFTQANGVNSHAEGNNTKANGQNSHAEGQTTQANGLNSHAEGLNTIASAQNSHAEGGMSTAAGDFSHAGGFFSQANGFVSFVHGQSSSANGSNTIVLGANIIGANNDTTYVDNLNIKTVPAGTSVNNLGIDATGRVVVGTSSGSEIFVTGGTYSTGTTIFTNNTGGTFSVTGYSTTTSLKYYAEPTATPTSPIVTGLNSIAIGNAAQANSNEMFVVGTNAGNNSTSISNSIIIGNSAGNQANNSFQSVFVGSQSGNNASGSTSSTFVGYRSGYNATDSGSSNFIGANAGENAKNSASSNFIGPSAGAGALNANSAVYLGSNAGYQASNNLSVNFIGQQAGGGASGNTSSNFIGIQAGYGVQNTTYTTLIGYNAGMAFSSNAIGNNNIIIGTNISVPNGNSNKINIGGVIFGHNTYSNVGTSPSITNSPNGRVGINQATDDGVNTLQVNGNALATQYRIPALNTAPASATDTGVTGEIRYTDTYIYVCIATNTWVRSPLTTW